MNKVTADNNWNESLENRASQEFPIRGFMDVNERCELREFKNCFKSGAEWAKKFLEVPPIVGDEKRAISFSEWAFKILNELQAMNFNSAKELYQLFLKENPAHQSSVSDEEDLVTSVRQDSNDIGDAPFNSSNSIEQPASIEMANRILANYKPDNMYEHNEIKKLLYKQQPKAKFIRMKSNHAYYGTFVELADKTMQEVVFIIPFSDLGDAELWRDEDAKLLIRYLPKNN
jgi:hypothetical protein